MSSSHRLQVSTPLSQLYPLYLVIFTGFLGYSLMITIFTPLLLHPHTQLFLNYSQSPHAAIWLGLLLFVYPGAQFLGAPIIGALSDRFGRKPPLIASLVGVIIFYAMIGWCVQINNFIGLIISTLLCGLFESNVAIAQSAIADVSDQSNRNTLFGYIYLSASMAYIIAPLFGGQLAHWINPALPFYLIACFLTLLLLSILFQFKETLKHSARYNHSIAHAVGNLGRLFSDNVSRQLLLINFILYFAVFGFFRCYPMYLVSHFHMNVARESLWISYVAIPIVLANTVLTRILSTRISPLKLTTACAALLIFFLCSIVIPGLPEWSLFFTLFLSSLAIALALPACATHLSLNIAAEKQGAIMGNNQALQLAGEAISGLVGGLLASVATPLPLFTLGCVSGVAAFLYYRQMTPSQ